ncbi:Coronin-2A [Manis pentadactyla]|nr:Coronin-2A [Manis pentadactyla]
MGHSDPALVSCPVLYPSFTHCTLIEHLQCSRPFSWATRCYPHLRGQVRRVSASDPWKTSSLSLKHSVLNGKMEPTKSAHCCEEQQSQSSGRHLNDPVYVRRVQDRALKAVGRDVMVVWLQHSSSC